jgi:pimeloyl-ACP methyl ester carboxylesterase
MHSQAKERMASTATVLMVHGAGGGGWEYDLWSPVFAKAGYAVVARDLVPVRGGYAETRLDDYIAQVVSWAPKDGGPVVLVGASMGGVLALKAAERLSPAAVVLVNSVAPAGVGPKRPAKKNPPVVRWADGPLADTRAAMPDSDEKTILWAWKRWRDESGAVMDALRAGVSCKKPRCPVLAVLGTADTDILHATGLALASWAGADVHTYRNMSHVGPLMSRRAAEVAGAVVGWLRAR